MEKSQKEGGGKMRTYNVSFIDVISKTIVADSPEEAVEIAEKGFQNSIGYKAYVVDCDTGEDWDIS